jgi:hypothetical protein
MVIVHVERMIYAVPQCHPQARPLKKWLPAGAAAAIPRLFRTPIRKATRADQHARHSGQGRNDDGHAMKKNLPANKRTLFCASVVDDSA